MKMIVEDHTQPPSSSENISKLAGAIITSAVSSGNMLQLNNKEVVLALMQAVEESAQAMIMRGQLTIDEFEEMKAEAISRAIPFVKIILAPKLPLEKDI